jgi:hypothetical protein
VQAGCQEPRREEARKQAATKVNTTASTNYQPKGAWESRAAHVTAKATDNPLESERGWISPGSQVAACFHRRIGNRRDPTRQPASGKDRAYKAGWLKASEAGRESEGFVVPRKACTKTRWREGTLLWSCGPGGKCEGMAEKAQIPLVKARQLRQERYERGPSEGNIATQAGMRVLEVTSQHAPVCQRPVSSVHAPLGRPSVSRMRENRTYGLKGGSWKQAGS